MHRSRTALAAALIVLPLALAGCSDDGDVDVQPGNVEVTPPDADVDAVDVDAPDVDVPDVEVPEVEVPEVEAPDVDLPDVDVDADVEESPSG